ncbi:MAG: glycosyltransferase family 2 protein [Kiritimatiellia bacterium]
MNTPPRVSVLMCVHNGEAHVRAAVESVLGQTLRDFELIVVDDASTDATPSLLRSFPDPRLRLLRNETNLGLTRSLNVGLRAVRGEYVARLDADDTCVPERLERQAAFLDRHPEVGLLGTRTWRGAAGAEFAEIEDVTDETELRWWLLFDNIFAHSSVMFRADLVRGGGYDEACACAQDYALWSAWADRTRFAKLAEPLVRISSHEDQISRRQAGRQREIAERVSRENLSRLLGAPVDARTRAGLPAVFPRPPNLPSEALMRSCRLCLRLFRALRTDPGSPRARRAGSAGPGYCACSTAWAGGSAARRAPPGFWVIFSVVPH